MSKTTSRTVIDCNTQIKDLAAWLIAINQLKTSGRIKSTFKDIFQNGLKAYALNSGLIWEYIKRGEQYITIETAITRLNELGYLVVLTQTDMEINKYSTVAILKSTVEELIKGNS